MSNFPFIVPTGVPGQILSVIGSFTYSANNNWRVTDGSILVPKGTWIVQVVVFASNLNAVNYFQAALSTNNDTNGTGTLSSASITRLATTTIANGARAVGDVSIYLNGSESTLYLKVFAEDNNSETVTATANLIRIF